MFVISCMHEQSCRRGAHAYPRVVFSIVLCTGANTVPVHLSPFDASCIASYTILRRRMALPPPLQCGLVRSCLVWSGLVPKNVDYPYLAKFHPSYPFRLALIHSNPKTAKMPPKMLITHISQNCIRPTPLNSLRSVQIKKPRKYPQKCWLPIFGEIASVPPLWTHSDPFKPKNGENTPKNVDYPYVAELHPSDPPKLAPISSNWKTKKIPPKILITHIWQNCIRPTPLNSLRSIQTKKRRWYPKKCRLPIFGLIRFWYNITVSMVLYLDMQSQY